MLRYLFQESAKSVGENDILPCHHMTHKAVYAPSFTVSASYYIFYHELLTSADWPFLIVTCDEYCV